MVGTYLNVIINDNCKETDLSGYKLKNLNNN